MIRTSTKQFALALFGCLLAGAFAAAKLRADDWLQFRGSDGRSVAAGDRVPVEFGIEKNVAWRAKTPGNSVSGPVVVGKRVYVTSSSGAVTQNKLHVNCFDVDSGKELWHRQFWATGRCFHHPTSANAAPTPASDGERVFAFYSSNDLACLDLDGNLLWYRGLGSDYPKAGNDVGMSSSPLAIDGAVIVQIENQGDSFAAGIDAATGETLWRIERAKAANWASPTMVAGPEGKPLAVLQSGKTIAAYEPRTGKQVWSVDAPCEGIPSSTAVGERLFVPARGITAIDVTAGSSSPTTAWDSNRLATGNASPVIHDGKVYLLGSRSGVLTCGDAKSGDQLWQLRLTGTFWATPVVAGDYLYCASQDAKVLVVDLSAKKGKLAATNELEGMFLGSPAVADNALYLRSTNELWKIAETK